MAEQRIIPSLKTITFTDYWCMLLFVAPLIFVLFTGVLIGSGDIEVTSVISRVLISSASDLEREDIFLVATVILVVVAPLLLGLRIRKIRRVFLNGMDTEGQVVFFRRFRDRGRIEFEFDHEGEIVHAANPVHLSRVVRSIYVGQTITVV